MNLLLIAAAIILFVLQTLALKLVKADTLSEKLLCNCAFCLLAAAGMGLLGITFPSFVTVGPMTLLTGILFGVSFSLTILFYLSAIACGPLSYTSFYLSASMLLPAAAGILFFKEPLKLSLFVAVIFFMAAFYLLNVTDKEQKAGGRWMVFCLLTFLCNGLSGVIQKTQQVLSGGQEATGMMFIGFGAAAVCYGTAFGISSYYLSKKKSGIADSPAAASHGRMQEYIGCLRGNLLPVVLLAIASFGGNLLLTYLAGRNPGSYLFPLIQGSIILGVTLCSVLFFKERLPLRGKLGLLAGTIGIIVINV